jgi:hypothetical protein
MHDPNKQSFNTEDDRLWRLDAAVFIPNGSSGPEHEDEGVHHFLRSKQIEVDGELTAVALPVKRHLVKYHEPCSEILEREAFGFTKMRPCFEFADRTIPWARHT